MPATASALPEFAARAVMKRVRAIGELLGKKIQPHGKQPHITEINSC
jgi:hypothetical protein